MQTEIIEPNNGIIIWQIMIAILIIFIIYFVIKIYKKISKYLDLKMKYLNSKIDKP